jgi:hypothetical protein
MCFISWRSGRNCSRASACMRPGIYRGLPKRNAPANWCHAETSNMRRCCKWSTGEAALLVQHVREINIRLTIQQRTQVQTWPLEMDGINLEASPVERAIGIVMVNLTRAPRVLRPLDCQGDSTRRAKFEASVLLVRRKVPTFLVGFSRRNFFARGPLADHQGRLEMNAHWPLQTKSVAVQQKTNGSGRDKSREQKNSEEPGTTRRVTLPIAERGNPAAGSLARRRRCHTPQV